MASCMFSRRAVSGARSRRTCRQTALFTAISICGSMAAHWIASTTRLRELSRSCGPRSQPDRRRNRQPEREERRKRGRRIDPHGYDAGKKIKGKKRHILVGTIGLLLHAIVHPADIQDRDGGVLVLRTLFGKFPFLQRVFADGGYQGP